MDNMSNYTNSSSSNMSKCAACGKGGDNLKVCTSCEQVSYCNAKCRKAHRSKHKKECRQLAAERHNEETAVSSSIDVHIITEKFSKIIISDDELFADPSPKEDCDICFLPMPFSNNITGFKKTYQPCCGKTLCHGCMSATVAEMSKGKLKHCCPFCRMPLPVCGREFINRLKKRMQLNDANAFLSLAGWYRDGDRSVPQDYKKAFELYTRAAKLGSIKAHYDLAATYENGDGVENDEEKSEQHFRLAAIGGNDMARHMLGDTEVKRGNIDRAMKHFMIAARSGWDDSLEQVGVGYKAGYVTKDEYTKTLRAYQDSINELKSEQRIMAADQELRAYQQLKKR